MTGARSMVLAFLVALVLVGAFALSRRDEEVSAPVRSTARVADLRAVTSAAPSTLPPGVPTRAQAGLPRAAPPPDEPAKEVAPPHVVAELDETRTELTARARRCATGATVEVKVDVTYRAGEARVTTAEVVDDTVDATRARCVVDALVGQTWTVAGEDKVFGYIVRLSL